MSSDRSHFVGRVITLPRMHLPHARSVMFLMASTLLGCSAETALTASGLTVRSTDGASISSYTAVLVTQDTVLEVDCAAGALLCTKDRLLVPEGTTSITIKSRGFTFETFTPPFTEARLVALAASASTADYVTGLAAGTEDAFAALAYPSDTELGHALAVKFIMEGITTDSPTVYFQNTLKNPIHYDFFHNILGRTGSPADFVETTYQAKDRTVMAGTLIRYPERSTADGLAGPTVLSFFPSDTLTPAHALLAYRLIEERLGFLALAGTGNRLVYVPAGATQEADATNNTQLFAAAGARWTTTRELYGEVSLQALNPGVAYGTLLLLTPEELAGQVVSSTDILVLPRLPNDLPLVGGTITGELQTPLAHVNVAAHARGTPNLALPGASTDDRIAPFVGKLVRFEVTANAFTLVETTLAEAEAFWLSQQRERYVPEHDDAFSGLHDFADVGFADSTRIGVKAANLAEMSHFMDGVTPNGFAIPFYYYDQYMRENPVTALLCGEAETDCAEEGRAAAVCTTARTLCDATAAAAGSFWDHADRLIADDGIATDTPGREAALNGLVYLVKHGIVDATFGAALDAKIGDLVGTAKVRLRSSTNSEDLPNFSGAGLYESHSATASGEKAASIRIREVWASVWRWRAFEERRFWNIDHRAVRMGIGVHPSYPDEAANGVLLTQNIVDPLTAGMYVNVQKGELAVTNPEGGEVAEAFSMVPSPQGGIQAQTRRWSSLSPNASLLSASEVTALYQAAFKIQLHFATLYGEDPTVLNLDMEFKYDGPDRKLAIKQVRPFAAAH